ncbi:MAG TPA: FAD-dependent oxidoreductase [Clostridiales bacterium]|nr:FAD-dependent oxidoreductase [Clostridiales bacterium]
MNTVQNTPVIYEAEDIIVGGGLKQLTAAIKLSKQDRKVLIITGGTYLLEELCNTNMVISPDTGPEEEGILQEVLPEQVRDPEPDGKRWLLHPDRLKINAERVCEQYGIQLLYNSKVVDTVKQKEKRYVRIAGKFGICLIGYKNMASFPVSEDVKKKNRYCVHIMNAPEKIEENKIIIPGETESYEVTLHAGSYNKHHKILQISCEESGYPCKEAYLLQCRQRCLEAVHYLKKHRKEFGRLQLGRFAPDGYYGPYDYRQEYRMGLEAAECILHPGRQQEDINVKLYPEEEGRAKASDPEGIELFSCNDMLDCRNYPQITVEIPGMKVRGEFDVIVAGGGTAGAMAALHAARNGLKTLLLEMNKDLGGTGTVGGVSTYWFGKRYRDVQEIDEEIQKIYDRLSLIRNPGIWNAHDDWNPGIKGMVLAKLCRAAGVVMEYDSQVFGVMKDRASGRIKGVAAVIKEEAVCCYAKYIVDATGDGDIASFAGAAFRYGSERDHITYWASLAQYTSPDGYRNNFSSMLIVSDPFDYTRFICTARLRGDQTFDHGTYVSPRESRHIRGRYEISLKDILEFRTYKDGIYTCFSNYDPKGKLSADMVYAGVLPPQVSIQIPLGALLPVDRNNRLIPGIIVAGKAISCTHNAFPSIRMQPDLVHQGTVIGYILAKAIEANTDIHLLGSTEIKEMIRNYTGDPLSLPCRTMKQEEAVRTISAEDRTHWVDLDFTEEVLQEGRSLRIMTAPSEEIRPLLEQRYADLVNRVKDKDRTGIGLLERLAGYLLWHGSGLGLKLHVKSIMEELKQAEGLPERTGPTKCVQLLPDHGVMPELVYRINLLAWSDSECVLEPFPLILERLKGLERDYININKGIYHYIEAFSYVAERTGRPEFIPLLLQLCEFKEFCEIMKPQLKAELLTERLSILLLSLYRALARCGERKGYEGLVQLLLAESLPIAASAGRELEALTGVSFGLDDRSWREYVNALEDPVKIQAISKKIW